MRIVCDSCDAIYDNFSGGELSNNKLIVGHWQTAHVCSECVEILFTLIKTSHVKDIKDILEAQKLATQR